MGSAKSKTISKKATVGATASGGAGSGVGLGAGPLAPLAPAGAQAAFQEYLSVAQALAPDAVLRFRGGDADVVATNVTTGVTNVMAQKSEILAQLPHEKLTVFSNLPTIALGFVYASLAARTGPARNEALHENLADAPAMRAALLTSAEALVASGVLPASSLAFMKVGRGPLANAHQLSELAALFTDNAPLVKGKTPVTASQIAAAAALGRALQSQLTPKGAPRKTDAAAEAASDTRDRFWTLLVQGHDRLWRVGALLFGEEAVATKVPALLSHAAHRSLATAAAKAARAAAKATAKATKASARATTVKPKPVKKPKKHR